MKRLNVLAVIRDVKAAIVAVKVTAINVNQVILQVPNAKVEIPVLQIAVRQLVDQTLAA
jgi:hypothetical protein